MSIKALKFNIDNLRPYLKAGKPVTVKDTEVKGLKLCIGKSKITFTFDKRVSGSKGSALTFSMRAEVGPHNSVNYKEAREWAGKLKRLCDSGIDPREDKQGREWLGLKPLPDHAPKPSVDRSKLTMKDAIEIFFTKKTTLKANSIRSLSQGINIDFCPSWLNMDIREITPAMIAERFVQRHQGGAPTCAWEMLFTYSNVWNTNRKLFKDEHGQKILGVSPIPEARQIIREEYGLKRHKPKRTVVKNHQLGRFIAKLDEIQTGTLAGLWLGENKSVPSYVVNTVQLAKLSLFTGLRFSEARFLKWEYVDMVEGYFQLPGNLRNRNQKNKSAFKCFDEHGKVRLNLTAVDYDFSGTKNGESHFVPMSSYVWDLFRELHATRTDNPFVFASSTQPERPIKRHGNVHQFIQQLGFSYSPHTARRTFASVANDVGVGFRDIKEMLNHVSESDVTSGYIVPGFNPTKNRYNFQKVCDHILRKHAEHLGKCAKETEVYDRSKAITELHLWVAKLGFTPAEASEILSNSTSSSKHQVA